MNPANDLSKALLGAFLVVACAQQEGPSGPEKAAAYHEQEAERAEDAKNPTPPTEAEATLQFPKCQGKKVPPFPADTAGSAFRAIVFLRITADGRTAEHCYLALEGDTKWEEKALGKVSSWAYEPQHAGQPRERVVTFRLMRSE